MLTFLSRSFKIFQVKNGLNSFMSNPENVTCRTIPTVSLVQVMCSTTSIPRPFGSPVIGGQSIDCFSRPSRWGRGTCGSCATRRPFASPRRSGRTGDTTEHDIFRCLVIQYVIYCILIYDVHSHTAILRDHPFFALG